MKYVKILTLVSFCCALSAGSNPGDKVILSCPSEEVEYLDLKGLRDLLNEIQAYQESSNCDFSVQLNSIRDALVWMLNHLYGLPSEDFSELQYTFKLVLETLMQMRVWEDLGWLRTHLALAHVPYELGRIDFFALIIEHRLFDRLMRTCMAERIGPGRHREAYLLNWQMLEMFSAETSQFEAHSVVARAILTYYHMRVTNHDIAWLRRVVRLYRRPLQNGRQDYFELFMAHRLRALVEVRCLVEFTQGHHFQLSPSIGFSERRPAQYELMLRDAPQDYQQRFFRYAQRNPVQRPIPFVLNMSTVRAFLRYLLRPVGPLAIQS